MKAFPHSYEERKGPVVTTVTHHGMDLRDYFAAKAMIVVIGQRDIVDTTGIPSLDEERDKSISDAAYRMADAMMEARQRK